jgi:50S ribosomal subunit-associated GTPase HflX
MLINKNHPNTIYSDVSTEVDRILKTLDKSTTDKEISQKNQNAQKILTDLKAEIDNNITALKKHSEWDVFTIAFYGVTNAGKSTIIETLRIMLGEQTKLKTQQQFKALQEKHGITDESFESLRQSILQNE